MKILHVVADGRPGGGTTNVLALVEDLKRLGTHTLTLVSQSDSYALDRARELGVDAVGCDFFAGRFDPRVPRRLGAIVRKQRPSVVHVHGARAGFFYAFARRRGHTPTAYTVRGYHFLRKPSPVRELAAMAERYASARADVTVHVCEYDQDLARRWRLVPPGRSTVVRNGIRPADIPPARGDDPRLVAFLGRLTYQKDPLLVLDVARILAPEGFRFRMIGGGEMESEVRRRIVAENLESVVEVLGSVPREEALEAMRDAGTFLLPSRWEGLPIAPVEAMEMGLPVVISDVSGNPEVVADGEAGILVHERSPRAYADALRRIADDPDLRARLIDAGKRVVRERFTRDRVTKEHLRLYEQLLEVE